MADAVLLSTSGATTINNSGMISGGLAGISQAPGATGALTVINRAGTINGAANDGITARGVFNAVTTLLCGQKLTNAPTWTVVTGFDWAHDIGESLKFGLNGNMRLESDKRTSTPALLAVAAGTGNITVPTAPGGGVNNFIRIPSAIEDGSVKINLRATIGSQDDRWALEFWGSNITNVHQRNVTFNTPLRGVGSLGGVGAGGAGLSRASFVTEPRTYGITARVKF